MDIRIADSTPSIDDNIGKTNRLLKIFEDFCDDLSYYCNREETIKRDGHLLTSTVLPIIIISTPFFSFL
jgi:hypothetical protein